MSSQRITRLLRVCGTAGLAVVAGTCAPPPAPVQRIDPAGLKAPDINVPHSDTQEWLPHVGRMPPYVLKRHGLRLAETQVLHDTPSEVTAAGLPGWKTVGNILMKAVRLAGERGVEISAVDERRPAIERSLDARALAGNDVRVDLHFACTSSRRLEALTGVKLQVVARQRSKTHTVTLPILADLAPGWETQSWWLHFEPGVDAVTLSIELSRGGAGLAFGGVDISVSEPPATEAATSRPADSPNLVPDGDFEAGQPRFFTSAVRRWADGSEWRVPLGWELMAEAPAGQRALSLPVAGNARVGFGPLDLRKAGRETSWSLALQARAVRPATLTATLRTRHGTLGSARFALGQGWQKFTAVIGQDDAERSKTSDAELSAAELVFDYTSESSDRDVNVCGLDAVRLTAGSEPGSSLRSAPIEIGLVARSNAPATQPAGLGAKPQIPLPAADGDLCNLFDAAEPLAIDVQLVADPGPAARKMQATLTLDLLDAWDRVAWTRTSTVSVPASGKHLESVPLQVPRGYYRMLAALWAGEPAGSELINRTSLRFGVISLTDPVPVGGAFGISADGGNISLRSTQLGLGWVRADLPPQRARGSAGKWQFALWQQLMERCAEAQLEVVSGTYLPGSAAASHDFLEQWLAPDGPLPVAVVISPPAISVRPAEVYANELLIAMQTLSSGGRHVQTVQDLSAYADSAAVKRVAQVLGIACTATQLPESSETLLERVGRQRQADEHLWDLAVPAQIAAAPDAAVPEEDAEPGREPVWRLSRPADPVRAASRMVRAVLIRSLAGAERVCIDAQALAPVRSIFDDDHRRLHEQDLSPRVAMVALDAMTSLLNDATLLRWIDLPGGARLLYYQKDDGRAVVAAWRPFGLSATQVSLGPVPSGVQVLDCLGAPLPARIPGEALTLEVNEVVQYLVAPVEFRDALWRALDTAQVLVAD